MPFNLSCNYKKSRSTAFIDLEHQSYNSGLGVDTYDFECVFKLSKLDDLATDEKYFPLVSRARIVFYFPFEVIEASLVSSYQNVKSLDPAMMAYT